MVQSEESMPGGLKKLKEAEYEILTKTRAKFFDKTRLSTHHESVKNLKLSALQTDSNIYSNTQEEASQGDLTKRISDMQTQADMRTVRDDHTQESSRVKNFLALTNVMFRQNLNGIKASQRLPSVRNFRNCTQPDNAERSLKSVRISDLKLNSEVKQEGQNQARVTIRINRSLHRLESEESQMPEEKSLRQELSMVRDDKLGTGDDKKSQTLLLTPVSRRNQESSVRERQVMIVNKGTASSPFCILQEVKINSSRNSLRSNFSHSIVDTNARRDDDLNRQSFYASRSTAKSKLTVPGGAVCNMLNVDTGTTSLSRFPQTSSINARPEIS